MQSSRCATGQWQGTSCRGTGHMRATRQEWHAAASVVQAAVRRWQSRRALAGALVAIHHGVLAVVSLQAAWRARPARRAFLQLRSAALTAQVGSDSSRHLVCGSDFNAPGPMCQ